MKHVEMLVFIVAGLFIMGLASWFLIAPIMQTISNIPEGEDSVLARIELLKTVAQIVLGIAVLGTLYFSWRRVNAAERTVDLAREGQITERFTRAIDQLGSDKVPIRLGGIYALERIARDSAEDHSQVMQVMMDCVPRGLSLDKQPVGDPSERSVPADVQAILTVLARLNTKHVEPGRRLYLRRTDLRGADLRDVNFGEAILIEADLCGVLLDHANLREANLALADFRCTILKNANLRGARLALADFRGADLTSADLRKANLDSANFQWGPIRLTPGGIQGTTPMNPNLRTQLVNADLRGAVLKYAHFEGADLTNADFRGADLTQSYFRRAWVTDAEGQFIHDDPTFNAILTDANLQGADIRGADFRDAVGLTQAQVDSAISDQETRLPNHIIGEVNQS